MFLILLLLGLTMCVLWPVVCEETQCIPYLANSFKSVVGSHHLSCSFLLPRKCCVPTKSWLLLQPRVWIEKSHKDELRKMTSKYQNIIRVKNKYGCYKWLEFWGSFWFLLITALPTKNRLLQWLWASVFSPIKWSW